MNKLLFTKSLFIISALFIPLKAQTFTLMVENQVIEGNEIHYDIYMQNTGTSDIYLGSSTFVLTFNGANFNNPSYIIDVQGGPGSNLRTQYNYSLAVNSLNSASLTITPPLITNQGEFKQNIEVISNSGSATLIANVKITGISNPSGTSDLQWKTEDPNKTIIRSLDKSSPWAPIDISSGGTFTNPPSITLPVELISFNAQTVNSGIRLTWLTASEISNYGFEVQRRLLQSEDWLVLGFVKGNGNSSSPKSYSFTDNNLTVPGKYLYRLRQIDTDGKFEYSEIAETYYHVPSEYGLAQNYPNPFNPLTRISFAVPKTSFASLKVYNVLGNQTAVLFNGTAAADKTYDFMFDGSSLASGVYYCVLETPEKTEVKKMILLR